jgi:hypothetical protein
MKRSTIVSQATIKYINGGQKPLIRYNAPYELVHVQLFVLCIATASCGQPSSIWRDFIVDRSDTYQIDLEDEVYLSDFDEPNDTVRASIEVRNKDQAFSQIKLSGATLVNDTLKINLHTTTPAYHHEYQIIVANGKYTIKYRFSGGGGIFDEVLAAIDTKLKLNSSQFEKGDVIRGHTEFTAECIKPCNKGLFTAIGNF